MTNYKRFISYLYYYELGNKKDNVGFARVETSNELCRVTVHCLPKSMPGKECKVHLLRRQNSLVLSEEVGTAEFKDGLLDMKLTYENGIIKRDSMQFKDCIGILLMYSKDYYIGAKWDGSGITYHEASMIEQLKQDSITREVPTQKEEPIKKEEAMKNGKPIKSVEPLEKEESAETEDPVQEIQSIEKPRETLIHVVPAQEVEEIPISKGGYESMTVIEAEKTIKTEEAQAAVETSESIESQEEENVKADDDQVIKEAEDKMERQESKEKQECEEKQESKMQQHITATSEQEVVDLWKDPPAVRAILDRFVRMYPFDDGEMAECVRLEPKDIGLLPMSSWTLGNNSFVLHSYCNYRHLLFTKKLTREGCEYYLMVPGALNPRERQLARMFGFENFKCSRRRCMRDGEFGYWYVSVPFHS